MKTIALCSFTMLAAGCTLIARLDDSAFEDSRLKGGGASDANSVSVSSPGCGITGKPTGDHYRQASDKNGTSRDYEVVVPGSYAPTTPLALVIVYHEDSKNESTAKSFGVQDAPGASTAAIFVYPKGIPYKNFGVGWDDSCGGYDMVFFDNMLTAIEGDYCIDERRIFAAGFSWGGNHVIALNCCRGDKLRAVSAGSGTDEFRSNMDYTSYTNNPCPTKPSAAIRFTHDRAADPANDSLTSSLLRSWNRCESTSTAVSPSPCLSYMNCTNPVIECAYDDLGTKLPQSWGTDSWNFFSSFK